MPDVKDWLNSTTAVRDVNAMRFIAVVLFIVGLTLTALMAWGLRGKDHFGQIPLGDDQDWYLNYAYMRVRELQDRDILYNNIGRSIEHARKADIVFLGNSVVQFALDWRIVGEFERQNGVRIYDMSFPGLASGAFLRSLLERWEIRDKLWIINADDNPDSFFAPITTDRFGSGRNYIPRIRSENRLTGYFNVASRNLSLRLDLGIRARFPALFHAIYAPAPLGCDGASPYPMVWRNIKNGTSYLDDYWGYKCTDAAAVRVTREQTCPASAEDIAGASSYISAIGGTTILTLIPYENWCPQRVREIAAALSMEAIIPPSASYAVWDGRHMARQGSEDFTRFFLSRLEQSDAFRQLMAKRRSEMAQ